MARQPRRPKIRTIGPVVGEFFSTYLVHPKGYHAGEPFVLEPWQQEILNEAYRVDADGRRLYRVILEGIPRGNGKTPKAAGLGLFELMARQAAPDIFNIAGAKDQAQLLTDFARAFVDRGVDNRPGKLKNWLSTSRTAVTHKQTHGVMRLLASSGSLQHGGSTSAALVDELWAFMSREQVETFTALFTALHKQEDAFLYAITTAGYEKKSLLGGYYDEWMQLADAEERCVVPGVGPCLHIRRDLENGILLWWYGPPDDVELEEILEDERIWEACNPASWVTVEVLRKQLALFRAGKVEGMDELDFVRLHCNGWTQARNVFIPAMPWKRCTSDAQLRRERIFVAVDVGLTHDTSAIGWSQQLPRNDSGKLPESEDGEPPPPEVLTRVKVWSANPEHERDRSTRHVFVPGGRVELELLFEFILELQEDYGIAELVYDPTFFEGEAQRLSRRRIKCAPVYQNGVLPAMAYQRFYQDVKEGRALHADDPVFTRHVLAAAGVKTERGWRVSELRSSEVIDALQAGAMSHWRAARHRGSVYQTRGVQTVSAPPREVEPDPH